MEEDLLKRRMLSNYCFSFLKLDLKEHIYYLKLQKERKRERKYGNKNDKQQLQS